MYDFMGHRVGSSRLLPCLTFSPHIASLAPQTVYICWQPDGAALPPTPHSTYTRQSSKSH